MFFYPSNNLRPIIVGEAVNFGGSTPADIERWTNEIAAARPESRVALRSAVHGVAYEYARARLDSPEASAVLKRDTLARQFAAEYSCHVALWPLSFGPAGMARCWEDFCAVLLSRAFNATEDHPFERERGGSR